MISNPLKYMKKRLKNLVHKQK